MTTEFTIISSSHHLIYPGAREWLVQRTSLPFVSRTSLEEKKRRMNLGKVWSDDIQRYGPWISLDMDMTGMVDIDRYRESPKWMVYSGNSQKQWIGSAPIYGNLHMDSMWMVSLDGISIFSIRFQPHSVQSRWEFGLLSTCSKESRKENIVDVETVKA